MYKLTYSLPTPAGGCKQCKAYELLTDGKNHFMSIGRMQRLSDLVMSKSKTGYLGIGSDFIDFIVLKSYWRENWSEIADSSAENNMGTVNFF